MRDFDGVGDPWSQNGHGRGRTKRHEVHLPGRVNPRLPCSAALRSTRRDQADPGGAEFKSPLAHRPLSWLRLFVLLAYIQRKLRSHMSFLARNSWLIELRSFGKQPEWRITRKQLRWVKLLASSK